METLKVDKFGHSLTRCMYSKLIYILCILQATAVYYIVAIFLIQVHPTFQLLPFTIQLASPPLKVPLPLFEASISITSI